MKSSMQVLSLVLFIALIVPAPSLSQPGTTAVPFLLISPSTEANGMGGTMLAMSSSSPAAMMFNPAQLGMMSRTHMVSTDFYSSRTQWLPDFRLSDLYLNSYSAMYGMKMGDVLPFDATLGFGYGRVYLNLGKFIVTSDSGPDPIGEFNGHESADHFVFGMSFDIGAIVGFGMTLKQIRSELNPFGTGRESGVGTADVNAMDLGIMTRLPLAQYFTDDPDAGSDYLRPKFDLALAYALNNIGGNVTYFDAVQADPLPRIARVGWSIETGLAINSSSVAADLITLGVAREAEDVLATRDSNGIGPYKGIFGDIDFERGLIRSESHKYVDVRRGFYVSILETITYREGSFEGSGELVYKTNGTTFSTKGLFKALSSLAFKEDVSPVLQYLLKHLEIRVSQSEYTQHQIIGDTKFNNIVLSLSY